MVCAQVLVVEDENIVAKAIQNELRGMGYSVPAIAATGEEAIRKALENHPDIVLMDIVLRGPMDGIEAAQQLRHRLDIPVVYLTAYGDEETLSRAKSTEPFGYLLKPYEEKELYTTIEMTLCKHRIERQLKETNQWLGATLRSIDNAVIATDGRQYVRLMNPIAEVLTGWKQAEAKGRDLIEVCNLIDPARRNLLLSLGTQAILEHRGLYFSDDVQVVSRFGSTAPVEGCIAPLHDEEHSFTGLVVVFRDVTDRKQVEQLQRQSDEHLRHSQKMEAVSRLAGGVAHDFNNLLTAILGNASLLVTNLAPTDPNRPLAAQVEAAALRASDIVRQLLAFSGRERLQLDLVNLDDVIGESREVLRRNSDANIVFDHRPGRDGWPVRADRIQLVELLRNLCLNAQDAMPHGGQLRIDTADVTIDEDHLRREWQAQRGDFVRLRVSDTGCGIAPAIQERMYEPFFTTKEPGRGTGLGLALVHGIVQEHGGWLECFTELGRGTRFDVYLPRYWQGDVPAATSDQPPVPRGQGQTVLLADAEVMIRDSATKILQRAGYHVLLAEDGVQAAELFQREKHRIDLVILDLNLPRLSGEDTCRQLRAIDPDVRVLLSSNSLACDQAATDDRAAPCIHKPYGHEELIGAVTSIMQPGTK